MSKESLKGKVEWLAERIQEEENLVSEREDFKGLDPRRIREIAGERLSEDDLQLTLRVCRNFLHEWSDNKFYFQGGDFCESTMDRSEWLECLKRDGQPCFTLLDDLCEEAIKEKLFG